MESRLDDLEIRYTQQELTIEQLSQTLAGQQKTIEMLRAELEYVKTLLKEAAPSAVRPESEETPPPHY